MTAFKKTIMISLGNQNSTKVGQGIKFLLHFSSTYF